MTENAISKTFHENKKLLEKIPVPVILLAIFLLALSLRMTPALMNAPWEPQYDSYWFYRYAEMVVNNNGMLPAWDNLSYYPPGRPIDKSTQFYVYLLAYSYMFVRKFIPDVTLVYVAKAVPAILTSLSVFPAYYIGKYLSGRNAGLLSALFIGVSPSILVRTGADPDNDGSVVFFSMLSFYSMMRLVKEPSFKNSAIAIASLTLFALSWYPFWYVYVVCFGGLVANTLLTAAYSAAKKRPFADEISGFKTKIKYFAVVLIGIIVIPFIFGTNTISYFGGFLVFGTNAQEQSIVNISVAELQRLDIFSESGWSQIMGRSAGLSFLNNLQLEIAAFLFLSILAIYSSYRKNHALGAILMTWLVFTFYAISSGIRFTMVFAMASAIGTAVGFGELLAVSNRADIIQMMKERVSKKT